MSPVALQTVVRHAAPVFLCKKPAALFTFPKTRGNLRSLNRAIQHHGLAKKVLRHNRDTVLLLVYHPRLLQLALGQPTAETALTAIGFPVGRPLHCLLDFLQARMAQQEDFPHEIGFFLGYPPPDVLGFMRHRGRDYKHCGKWKVYGDVPHALALFREYDQCSAHLADHLENGGSLYDITANNNYWEDANG